MKKLLVILLSAISLNAFAVEKHQLCSAMEKFAVRAVEEKQKGTNRLLMYQIIDNETGGKPAWKILRSITDAAYSLPVVDTNLERLEQKAAFRKKVSAICEISL